MKRHPLLRASTLALAALFVLTQLVDGSGAHGCPMHDAVAGAAVGGVPHAAASHHGTPAEDHQHQGPCTCLGACHAGTVALATSDVSPAPLALPAATASLRIPSDRVPESPSHLLPFAIGPPLLA